MRSGRTRTSRMCPDIPDEEAPVETAPFFVTISRHSGFRRLHKVGGCSTHPWSCYKVEYITRVVSGVADAVCKTCQRSSGKSMDENEDNVSSSSGTSSSTEVEDAAGSLEVQRDLDELPGFNE